MGADPALARKAAMLAKADLATEMVGEFPELQGLMGRYYAGLEGHEPEVCAAIEEHYKPQGPSDRVPTNPVSIAVALADKLDTLVGFWAIDEKPTGSKDPYALRRAALGVIRLVVENGCSMTLNRWLSMGFLVHAVRRMENAEHVVMSDIWRALQNIEFNQWDDAGAVMHQVAVRSNFLKIDVILLNSSVISATNDLLTFFHDRLKVMLREQGTRHDLVDAVLSARLASPAGEAGRRSLTDEGEPPMSESHPHPFVSDGHLLPVEKEGAAANDDLLSIVTRVHALSAFLATEDGTTLLAGYKRAANILKAEEKKDGDGAFEGNVDIAALKELAEQHLHKALLAEGAAVEAATATKDYPAAMAAMARVRAPVDAFFEAIFVNDPDHALRLNRLRLLAMLRRVTSKVADFSKVAG